MGRFTGGNGCIYNIGYHVIWSTTSRKVWTPKCRVKVLYGVYKGLVAECLLTKADELEVKIENIEIMPDHIHLFIKCSPRHKISDIIGQLKGYSSYMVRKTYPWLYKYNNFWSSSYCEYFV